MRIAFALGGGGARGIAHIGVIHELEKHRIKPDLIVGTSMGATIGAMYAQLVDSRAVERKLRQFIESDCFKAMDLRAFYRNDKSKSFFGNVAKKIEEHIVINLSISHPAVFKEENFRKAVDFLLDDGKIEDLPLKFAAVAGDLLTGEKAVITSGDIKTAVMASSSIPGFLPPVKADEMLLTDGEITDLIPAETARELGANFVVAVDIRQGLNPPPPLENAMDIIFRAGQIRSHELTDRMLKAATVVIQPEVSGIHWTHFEKAGILIELGREAGAKAAPQIGKMIRIRRLLPKYW